MPEHYRVPAFESGQRGALETVIAAPCRSAGGELVYPTLLDQAAVFFYEACKMHAFLDGNKRIAVLLLLAFLGENGWQLGASDEELSFTARDVAGSAASDRAVAVSEMANWIGQHLRVFGG